MNVHDYLIDHSNVDWADLLSDWKWLLPPEFTVWLMNRYGDLFLILPDGIVHMLDVGGGSLTKLANDRDEFARVIDEEGNAEDCLMIPLVDRLVKAGVLLEPGHCYSFVTPAILGVPQGTDASAWIAARFGEWWRGRAEEALSDAESAASAIRDELARMGGCESLGEAMDEHCRLQDASGGLRCILGIVESS
jgi:Domain of unknown function (DUF1851)